ncbi:cleavage and polyadenylation specificity factor subunit 2 [Apophysomyces sp. BC1034]|nr:cleavage and polyadenylation specificity factor subunit 2 [Apophysomyces sp. BC1015]KAG0166871.1 cleavage and polyadenylation specificity factor subunit 2 [Apophysomyces sp. BC1021]KAG0183746.1 cleavage and polyadenylation specificity factor subunit 2 [Apophysomyces sp. BC1034]
MNDTTVVVIGAGLAGLTAALEAHNHGAKVILIDKEKNVGGNSMKATSGINAVTEADTAEAFLQDTLSSGGGLSNADLAKKIVYESNDAIQWLENQDPANTLQLSLVSQCGGHTHARTHRCPPYKGAPVPVGWKLVDTLKKKLLQEKVDIYTGTLVTDLIVESGRVVGLKMVRSSSDAEEMTEELRADAIVLASGGFGGQTKNGTLLETYAPQLLNLATTNGPWADGNGVQLGLAVGATAIDMDQVQIHPTGFVDPNQPDLATKFLAPEALRGYGAILIDAQGHRFANELARRDELTNAIFKHTEKVSMSPPHSVFLVMTDEAVDAFGRSTLEFYAKKGFFKKYQGTAALAESLNLDLSQLENEWTTYDRYVDGVADDFGKTKFACKLMPAEDTGYWVATITPCVHYTMGGLQIDVNAAVQADGKPIPGLYAAGEVTGGVHGRNRLAGNSLLECVVFGRTAGRNAALMQK